MQDAQDSRRSRVGARSVVWAWACLAVTPVTVLVALIVAWSGLGDSVGGVGPVALVVALVAAPTAGLVLALRARRAGRRSGMAAAVASGVVLAAVLVLVGGEVLQSVTYKIPTVRAPAQTAFVVADDDGFWFEVAGDANAPTAVGHEAGTPIPADYDVAMATGWRGTSLDQFETEHRIKMRIPEAGIDMTYDRGTGGKADSKAYGGGATLYDAYWVRLLLPLSGFKPSSGTQVYASHWWVPLTDTEWESGSATNLTADGKLPQGTYTVYYEETVQESTPGLVGVYDGPKTTRDAERGTTVTASFTFTVGPPAP
jgi:hypothetical protein